MTEAERLVALEKRRDQLTERIDRHTRELEHIVANIEIAANELETISADETTTPAEAPDSQSTDPAAGNAPAAGSTEGPC